VEEPTNGTAETFVFAPAAEQDDDPDPSRPDSAVPPSEPRSEPIFERMDTNALLDLELLAVESDPEITLNESLIDPLFDKRPMRQDS
jgi:hypothetical protein